MKYNFSGSLPGTNSGNGRASSMSAPKWLHYYRCSQITTTIWNEFMGKILMPIIFFCLVLICTTVNFIVFRISSLSIGVRLSMLAFSGGTMILYFVALSSKSRQCQLFVDAVQSRRRECISRINERVLRSCKPNVFVMGSFYKIDRSLVLMFPFVLLNYTATLFITFKT